MSISSGHLYYAIQAISDYTKSTEGIDRIIITHSLAASAAAVASGWIPGAGGIIATGIAMGFTLTMYIRICKQCGFTLKKNILKSIASVVIAETASYLGVAIAAETIMTFIPGINIGSSIIAGIINFAMVYIAGILFLKMMAKVFKAKKKTEYLTVEDWKEYMKKEATKESIDSVYKEAKTAYKETKKDKSYKTDDIEPTE